MRLRPQEPLTPAEGADSGATVARTMVQGRGLRTSVTAKRVWTKRRKPQRVQWLTWPGVLPQSAT